MKKKDIIIKSNQQGSYTPFGKYVSKQIVKTLPFWNSLGVTPNILTTFGLICSIICIYCVYKKNATVAVIFFILRTYFDYADGLLARKYKQATKFGDYYDHIVDTFFLGIPLILVFFFSNLRILTIPLIVFLLFSALYNINIEEIYNKETNGKGGNLLFGSFIKAPKVFYKLWDDIYSYVGIIILIIILCNYKK
jgi:phosphatidylserine synthase|tara:strand:+ start:757 stop:1338 length:582 start_codon:yes stop_codon:yes gene_type:complete